MKLTEPLLKVLIKTICCTDIWHSGNYIPLIKFIRSSRKFMASSKRENVFIIVSSPVLQEHKKNKNNVKNKYLTYLGVRKGNMVSVGYISPVLKKEKNQSTKALQEQFGISQISSEGTAKPATEIWYHNGVSLPHVPQQCRRGPVTQKLNHLRLLVWKHTHTSSL